MILGHQKQWQFLKDSIKTNKTFHAYLFIGESSLGKRKVAKEFIKLLNCQNSTFNKALSIESCQNCRSCKAIQKEIHPDLILIEPKNKKIHIAQIRELSRKLSFKPYSAAYKAVIIDKAHLMNKEAQNCLLKTLEEPREKAILILLSEHSRILFPTILSRVQKIKFQPVSQKEIKNYFKDRGAEEKLAFQLSIFSQGKPGIAINFFKDKEKFEIWEKEQKEVLAIITDKKTLYSRLQYLKNSTFFLEHPKEALTILLNYFREILLFKSNAPIPNLYRNFTQNFSGQANIYSFKKLKKILNTIESMNFLLSTTNVNSKLALEMVIIEI